jgi:Tfp pilus assembly PilM family ATPase
MAKKQILVGVDMDSASVRGIRLSFDPGSGKFPRPVWDVLSSAEINGGNLLDDVQTVSALRNLRESLGVRPSDKVSICLSGKQTYSVQMDARRIPDDEMAGMLGLELRKSMPFELSEATFDYQVLPAESRSSGHADGGVSVMVSAVANPYLNRQVDIYGRAGLPPCHADLLPVSVANAFWAACENDVSEDEAVLILHFGVDLCTLVIDGKHTPFFSRSFSFNMAKAVGGHNAHDGNDDGDSKDIMTNTSSLIDVLADEVVKSATYYKNTHRVEDVSSIYALGAHASHSALDELAKNTGCPVRKVQTASLVRSANPLEPGKYDLAIALAMQAA